MYSNLFAAVISEPSTWYLKILYNLASIILIVVALYVVQRVVRLFINRYFSILYKRNKAAGRQAHKKRYDTLANAFRQIADFGLWAFGALIILEHLGVNYATLLAGAGAIGLFLGIAAKDAIMDLYNGFMVLVEDQYRVGDIIEVSPEHTGKVENITLRTVVLRDLEGSLHTIPHHLATAVINKTYDYSYAMFELNIPHDANIHKVKKLIDQLGGDMAEDAGWKHDILYPLKYQQLVTFDESNITVRISGKVRPGKQWEVASEYRTRLKEVFDKNGIETPFSERAVNTINKTISQEKSLE